MPPTYPTCEILRPRYVQYRKMCKGRDPRIKKNQWRKWVATWKGRRKRGESEGKVNRPCCYERFSTNRRKRVLGHHRGHMRWTNKPGEPRRASNANTTSLTLSRVCKPAPSARRNYLLTWKPYYGAVDLRGLFRVPALPVIDEPLGNPRQVSSSARTEICTRTHILVQR